MENNSKYRAIPAELRAFADRNGLSDSSGDGYRRRVALADLLGMTKDQLKVYLRPEYEKASRANIWKIKTVLRLTGDLPPAESVPDRVELALGLGAATRDQVAAAVGSPADNAAGRIVAGDWHLSRERQKLLDAFLADVEPKVSEREKHFTGILGKYDFVLKRRDASPDSATRHAPPPDAAETSEAPQERAAGSSADSLVGAAGALVLGLLPILKALNRLGKPEHFRKLRDVTATSHSSHGIFELKQLLGPMCSEKAREISKK